MRKKSFVYILILLLSSMLTACDYFPYFEEEESGNDIQHTLILYLMADSSLSSSLDEDLRETINAVDEAFNSKARIVVYYDRPETRTKQDSTTLFLLKRNNINTESNLERLEVLKQYYNDSATDPASLQQVLNDVKELVPSRTYGLLFSGHGTGWFPAPDNEGGTTIKSQRKADATAGMAAEHNFKRREGGLQTRSLGTDNYYTFDESRNRYVPSGEESYIDMTELAQGLSPIHFKYIVFDACFMSSIELLYELRNTCDYIIASPTEILSYGFPYTDIVRSVFNNGASIYNITEKFMDYYWGRGGAAQSASIALIDCSELDGLAEKVKAIYSTAPREVDELQIQALEGLTNHVYFDMNQYVAAMCSDDELYDEYLEQFNRTVLYRANTPEIFSIYNDGITILHGELNLCGISAYIPRDRLPITKQYWENTSWAKFVTQ